MPSKAKPASSSDQSAANLGFEAKLWLAADKLRNNMDSGEYKHVSDAFEEMRARLLAGKGDYEGSDPEDADEYCAENVFWVPKEARWPHLQASTDDICKIVSTYHRWRCDDSPVDAEYAKRKMPYEPMSAYADIPGFCKSAATTEIAAHGHILTPGRYVGAEEVEDDGDPFEEKMPRLVAEVHGQFAESAKLEQAIRQNLKGFGYV